MASRLVAAETTVTFVSEDIASWADGVAEDGDGGSTDIVGKTIQVLNIQNSLGSEYSDQLLLPSYDSFEYVTSYEANGGGGVYAIMVRSSDGSEFQINGFSYSNFGETGVFGMTVEGFRDSSPVASMTFNTSSGVFASAVVALDSSFDSVDTVFIRLTSGANSWHGINGIKIDNAVPPNATPAITNLGGDSVAWAGVGNTVTLDASGNAALSDGDFDALNGGNGDWSGGSLGVQRPGTAISSDTFGFNTSGALFTVSGGNLQSGGQTFATFTNTSGVLSISFTSSGTTATTALVNDVARRVTYRNDTPAGDATLRFTLGDGAASTTADVTVTSDTITVTNTTDTSSIDITNGVSFSEAVAIAAADATGSQTIVFNSSLAATSLTINSVSLNESLTFDMDAASGMSLSGGTITLGAGTTQTFSNGTGDTATLASVIAGSGAFAKAGAGGLTLSGSNTYSGATTVSAGTLSVSGGDAISGNSSVTVSGGATLALSNNEAIGNLSGAGEITLGSNTLTTTQTADTTFSGNISGTGGLTVNQTGAATFALTLSGNNTYSGTTITINYGRLRLDGDASVSSSSQLRANGNSIITLLSDQTVGSLFSNNANASIQLGSFALSAGGDNTSTTVSGAISGTGSLVKQGSGTLTLAGTNSYSGTTTVSAGTLSVASDSNLGSDTLICATGSTLEITGATTLDNAITLAGDATVSTSANATISGVISGGSSLGKTGASTLTLSGNNTYTGTTTVGAGTLSVASDASLGGDAVSLAGGTTLAITGATTVDNNLVLDGSATISASADATLSGNISGPGNLTKSGASTVTLSGTNSYSGTTTVSAGALSVASDGNIGSGTISLAAGASIVITGATTIDNTIVLNGDATLNSSANATISGVISGANGLSKSGAGTLTLSGNNTWTGTTSIAAGALSVSGDGNLGGGTVAMAGGTTLLVAGTDTIDNNLILAGAATVQATSALTWSGVISGAGTLEKTGAGTLTLSGNNTSSGITSVSAGTLSVTGSTSNATTVASGATLAGTGTLGGAVTVQSGGVFIPQSLTINGDLTMDAGSTLAVGIDGTTAGTQYDQATVAGAVDVTGATLSVTHGYTPGSGDTYAIIVNDAADAVTGTFSGLAQGGTIAAGGNGTILTASYTGDSGNDFTLSAPIVPVVTLVSSSTADGSYGIGDTISVTLTFDASVTVTGTPLLQLETGTVDRTASYASGSGTSTLSFTYTVQADDQTADLDYVSTSALDLNAGTIRSALEIDATLALPAPGAAGSLGANKGLVIDGIRPTATIVVDDTSVAAGETSAVTITFSEAVTGFTNADLTVANGSLSAVSSSDGGITWTATLTPTGGIEDNTNLISLDNTGVADAAGNTGTGTTDSNSYAMDTLRPTASVVVADTILAVGQTSGVTITFSEAVSGLTAGDFTVANGALSGLGSADGGIIWTATLTPTAGLDDSTNLVTLDNTGVTDSAGNTGSGTTDSNNYAIDTLRPSASIVVADTELALEETSIVTITFSEAVSGLTGGDLTVENGTLSGLGSLDGGITWTATLTPTAEIEDNTNLITLANTGQTDAAGNAGTGTTDSNNYVVDTVLPVNAVAAAQTTTTVVPLIFSDASENPITVTESSALTTVVSVGAGTLTATTGGGAVITNNGTSAITLDGTAAEVNAALDGLTYSPAGAGAQTIAVQSSDAVGNLDSDTIEVTVENAVIVVTSTLDTGDDAVVGASFAADQADGSALSLREALHWAFVGDSITFDLDSVTAGLQGGTIVLGGGALMVVRAISIDGDLDSDGVPDVTISGNNASRVMSVGSGLSGIELTGLELTGGAASGGGGGLAIGVNSTVTVRDSDISNNIESGWGGGGVYGSGVTLTLINTTISGNSSDSYGGGIRVVGGGTLNLISSTVSGNATTGTAAHGGGIQFAGPVLTIVNSTISGNAALGASSDGGGLRITAGTSFVHNSTIVGNAASNNGGGVSANGTTDTFVNTVVAGNTAGAGATAWAGGSALATGGSANDASGTVESATHCFFGSNVSITVDTDSLNNQGTDSLLLGDLALNGEGVHRTHKPQNGSALIDAGSDAALPTDLYDLDGDSDAAEALAVDANGGPRISGGVVDIGAVEAERPPEVTLVDSTSADGPYKIGDTLTFIVEFDVAVTVDTSGGTPALTLETGATDRDALYFSGSGTSTLSFSYTVQAGDVSSDIDYTSTAALVLNGGTITGATGYDAVLTLASPGAVGSLGDAKAIMIDGVAPTVTDGSIGISGGTGAAGAYRIGDVVTATWNNTASGDNNSDVASVAVDLSEFGGGGSVPASDVAGTWTATFTLVAGSIEAGNRNVSFTVTDEAGNVTITADTTDATVDTLAPVITSDTTAGGTYGAALSYTITASGDAVTFDALDLPSGLSINTSTGSISGTPSAAGTANVTLVARDAAGNEDTAALALTIGKAGQTVTFAPVGAITVGTPVSLSATASSGLAVTFSVVSGNGSISGASFTANDSNPIVLRASQAGDLNYHPASAEQTIGSSDISKLAQTITFPQPDGRLTTDAPFALEATASSGLTVSFAVQSGPASLSGNTLTLTGAPGTVTIVASQEGNAAYTGAPSVTRSFAVNAPSDLVFFGILTDGSQNVGSLAGHLNPAGTQGVLIGHVPGHTAGFVVSFTPDEFGAFTATISPFTAAQAHAAPREGGAAAAPVTWTFHGQLSGDTISGAIDEISLSFAAVADPVSGPTASMSGYYTAAALDTSSDVIYAIVGTTGDVYVLVTLSDLVAAGTGTVDTSSGDFILDLGGDISLDGNVHAPTTTVDGAIVRPGGAATDFSGVRTDTARNDRLINLSSRARVGTRENVAITGFVVSGSEPKSVLLRAIGPGLEIFDIANRLADPRITLIRDGVILASNDDWGTGDDVSALVMAMQESGAFALAEGSRDAAMLLTLQPGVYTAIIEGGEAGGVALAEIYDASVNPSGEYQRLINISTRGYVGSGDDTLIGGFVVTGNAPKRVLIRGVGPALAAHGVTTPLLDPTLTVFQGGTAIAQNTEWGTGANTAVELAAAANATGAFALEVGSADAALLITLAPGVYTAHVTSAGGATGIGLIEIYELPTP